MTAGVRLMRRGAVLAAPVGIAAVLLAGCSSGAAAASAPAATPPTTVSPETSTTTRISPSTGTPSAVPPFIARATWVKGSGGRSLHIVPTASGRAAHGAADGDEAWTEVLALAPDADQPGMRAQFDCHWSFARLVQPDKPSWNIEPWRPVVTPSQMVDARCNPGGAESAEN